MSEMVVKIGMFTYAVDVTSTSVVIVSDDGGVLAVVMALFPLVRLIYII